jgi:hypothetical protein
MINKIHYDLVIKKDDFLDAKPFPYLVLDNFFTPKFFERLNVYLNKVKKTSDIKKFSSSVENEKTIFLNQNISLIEDIAKNLSDEKWLNNIRELTKISDLNAPDINHGSLSNYHEMKQNGVLGSHVDHAIHPKTRSKHVLNIIIYLNKNWHHEYGGNTLLYDLKGKKIIKKIEYIPNRAVIFLHTPYSFHGVDKITKQTNEKRKSFYIDYYSDLQNPYQTFNLDFPKNFFSHGTTFVFQNVLEYLKIKNYNYTKTLLKYNINKFINR